MTVIAWDFDGVLNRSVVDGRFLWAERFEEDTGRSLALFQDHVFARGWHSVLTGREDLRDRVARWAEAVGHAPGPDALLAYWFERDLRLDPAILALVEELARRGVPQILATNNEPRRVAFLEREAALGALAGRIFASGRLGAAKPEPAFFEAVTGALGVAPDAMILVDDLAANVEQARRLGWRAVHLSDATRPALAATLLGAVARGARGPARPRPLPPLPSPRSGA